MNKISNYQIDMNKKMNDIMNKVNEDFCNLKK